MERDPFALIEAMTIAAYATGCERGYVYIRGEYPRAAARPRGTRSPRRARAATSATTCSARASRFDIEIRKGAGAYICGEETAIFESIEGNRGEPRNKPPFPVVAGPLRQADGRQQRRDARQRARHRRARPARPTPRPAPRRSTGTKLFCLSGHVERPGVYEVPFGDDAARAARRWPAASPAGGRCRRSCMGGAAGGFLAPRRARPAAHVRGARARRRRRSARASCSCSTRPSTCRACCMRIAAFFRNESCGQCVPCRVGTVRQQESLARLVSRQDDRRRRARARRDRRGRPVHARRLDLRPRPDGVERDRVRDRAARGLLTVRRERSCWRRRSG